MHIKWLQEWQHCGMLFLLTWGGADCSLCSPVGKGCVGLLWRLLTAAMCSPPVPYAVVHIAQMLGTLQVGQALHLPSREPSNRPLAPLAPLTLLYLSPPLVCRYAYYDRSMPLLPYGLAQSTMLRPLSVADSDVYQGLR